MSWLSLALGLLKISSAIISYLHNNKMMATGAALEALKSLEQANAAIEKGRVARQAADVDSELHPERLRDQDGFKRPD